MPILPDYKQTLVSLLAASCLVGAAAVLSAVGAPDASAATICGTYTPRSVRGSYNLVVISGNASCATARGVFDDLFAGKGRSTARNAVSVDGFSCVGNPAGAYESTGVLSYCTAPGTRFELEEV